MKIIKPLHQSLLYKVFEDARKRYLSVAIQSFFLFETCSWLLSEVGMWKFAASELGKDAMLGMCMPKPKEEVLVVGKCFAPETKPAPAYEVSLQMGPIDKTLYVFGDRFWKRKKAALDAEKATAKAKSIDANIESTNIALLKTIAALNQNGITVFS